MMLPFGYEEKIKNSNESFSRVYKMRWFIITQKLYKRFYSY